MSTTSWAVTRAQQQKMSIEIFDYLLPFQTGELSFLSGGLILALICVPSFLSTYIAQRFVSPVRRLRISHLCVVAVSATLLGLVLTSITYNCSACRPRTDGCRVITIGVPFPQQVQDRDPEPPVLFDVCRLGSERSRAAVLGNFSLGALGLPLGVMVIAKSRPKK
jgi:hypothetical protein